MTKQPEALRMADLLETNIWEGKCGSAEREQAAAKLRRLYEVNQELLEALLRIMRHIPSDFGGASFSDDWWKAQRIIAKATGGQQ